ncbi:hypothetical protein LAU_0090 [Lausannevirus]|uniref:Uncharacterized protein n=1 Tax=Lausannevirus TaxID=999883 RepID=F2WL20_9VIRU|nr:hypothetical protein LAU_0090 [Lausannevirus]AEA06943.1 hypothetical protein LAU_0090 [Lausannevirus]
MATSKVLHNPYFSKQIIKSLRTKVLDLQACCESYESTLEQKDAQILDLLYAPGGKGYEEAKKDFEEKLDYLW